MLLFYDAPCMRCAEVDFFVAKVKLRLQMRSTNVSETVLFSVYFESESNIGFC